MSVIVQMLTPHQLTFNSYSEGILLISNNLNIHIIDVNDSDRSHFSITQTDKVEEVLLFTNSKYFEKRFEQEWGIWVETNFKLCQRFVVYKRFVEFYCSGLYPNKTHLWRSLVSKQYNVFPHYTKSDFEASLTEWNNTRKFIADITRKLGGNQILYSNDGATGSGISDNLLSGTNFKNVVDELRQTNKLIAYEDLTNNTFVYSDEHVFIEELIPLLIPTMQIKSVTPIDFYELVVEFTNGEYKLFSPKDLNLYKEFAFLAYPNKLIAFRYTSNEIMWYNGVALGCDYLYKNTTNIDHKQLSGKMLRIGFKNQAPTDQHPNHHEYYFAIYPFHPTEPFSLGESIGGGHGEMGGSASFSLTGLINYADYEKHLELANCAWVIEIIKEYADNTDSILARIIAEVSRSANPN
jgi:hypothetical protein